MHNVIEITSHKNFKRVQTQREVFEETLRRKRLVGLPQIKRSLVITRQCGTSAVRSRALIKSHLLKGNTPGPATNPGPRDSNNADSQKV
jgi:hypothetical protein